MDKKEKIELIDKVLKELNKKNTGMIPELLDGLQKYPRSYSEKDRKYRILEEELVRYGLVKKIRGGDNSTPHGYFVLQILPKGMEFVLSNRSVENLYESTSAVSDSQDSGNDQTSKMHKRFQFFISSTYLDLKKERQDIVEAVLGSGNIPAGMELFAAGDQKQWEIIQRWIEDSDAYILLLGGRYGSIEPESGLSYTELEYDYAVGLKKPLFALVLEDGYLYNKPKEMHKVVFEEENTESYRTFKERVLSKMTGFCKNRDQIKLETYKAITSLIMNYQKEMVGWIRADSKEILRDVDFVKIYEEARDRGSNFLHDNVD